MVRKYIIVYPGQQPFQTDYFEPENHFVEVDHL